jgi:hypothetical protein
VERTLALRESGLAAEPSQGLRATITKSTGNIIPASNAIVSKPLIASPVVPLSEYSDAFP